MNNYSIVRSPDFSWFLPADWAVSRFTTLNYKYSGIALANEINTDEWVLDVGCGINPFKGIIKNLVGIDPITYQDSAVDVVTTLENFETDQKFNVFFCLGSLHPTSKPVLYTQFTKLKSLATPKFRIYIRAFQWNHGVFNKDLIKKLCNDFNLTCSMYTEDYNVVPSPNKNKNSAAKKYYIKLESL